MNANSVYEHKSLPISFLNVNNCDVMASINYWDVAMTYGSEAVYVNAY